MTASTHWLATAAAQAVLERGGNAFDAVVAGGFVLHVVEPHLNGPGGDLVGIFASAGATEPRVLMGQGPAPERATIQHYRNEGLGLVPGSGALAAAVPGAVDAWLLLLHDHGTWELADVLSFAIGYARDGHPLVPQAAATIARVTSLFRTHWPSSAAAWLVDGEAPEAGAIVRNPAYADLLSALVAAGSSCRDDGPVGRRVRIQSARSAWREIVGREAQRFLAEPHRHSTGGDHAGVMTEADVAGFAASYEAAVTHEFRGTTVAKAGLWSQGPALLEVLGILDGIDDADLDPATERGAHTVLEALKLAYADRDAWFGDTEGGLDPAALLDPDYLAARRALIGATASVQWRPGSPDGRAAVPPPLREVSGARDDSTGEPTVSPAGSTRGDTCHIDVVDRWGNIIAVTPSGGWLQSSPTIPALGFCLGTRLQMTWLTEGHPASLVPGRRPRTTLTPTLLLSQGRPLAAMGSPGGDQQDQWQLLVLLRMLIGGARPQEAIDAPVFHTTAMPESFWPRTWTPAGAVVEGRADPDVVDGLRRRGHRVTMAADWSLGRVSAVGIDASRGVLWAAANPRGMQGYAAGR